jgi:hypothetical protein
MTDPAYEFSCESHGSGELIGAVAFVLGVRGVDLGEVDRLIANPPDEKAPLVEILADHRKRIIEMQLERMVDYFLTYLAELLALLYRTRPETLRARTGARGDGGDTIRVDEVLDHSSIDDLVATIADDRVYTLSYKGLRGLNDYLAGLGFDLFPNEKSLRIASLLVELRNLIAHNRGRVSRVFLRRLPDPPLLGGESLQLGDEVDIPFAELGRMMLFLDLSVADIDSRAIAKWNLPATGRVVDTIPAGPRGTPTNLIDGEEYATP